MPNYHFHIDGDEAEAIELPDDNAARMAARETFGMMIWEGSVGAEGSMKVVDGSGRSVLTLRFSTE